MPKIESGTSENSKSADSSNSDENESPGDSNVSDSNGSDSEDGGVLSVIKAQEEDDIGGDDLSEISNGFRNSLYVTTKKGARVEQLVPFRCQARLVSRTHVQNF